MLLGNYFRNIKKSYKKFYFSDISFNSSQIKKNNIFFAIRGNKIDGNNYISSAIKNGLISSTAPIVLNQKSFHFKPIMD